MFSTRRAMVVAALAAGVLLAGCDGAPEPAKTAPSGPNKPAAGKTAVLPPDMVAAVSAGSTRTIGVHFALKASPVVNEALPIDIAIVPHLAFSSVRAHFEAHDGLALISGETLDAVASVSAEKPLTHQLVVLPKQEGVYMITASVESEGDDGAITRVFSIPVIVAPAAAPGKTPAPAANPAPAKPAAN